MWMKSIGDVVNVWLNERKILLRGWHLIVVAEQVISIRMEYISREIIANSKG